jgi:hypothetical protein
VFHVSSGLAHLADQFQQRLEDNHDKSGTSLPVQAQEKGWILFTALHV